MQDVRAASRQIFVACRALLRLGAAFCGVAASVAASAAELPPTVQRALKANGIPANAMSLYVREVGREAALIEHRATRAMNPASTMKLVTTLVALDVLTPQYTWKTDFLTTGAVRDGALDTPLIIRGSGDPKFTWEHLQAAVNALRAQGIRELRGGLQFDRTRFAPATYDSAAFDGLPLRPYNATPDALLFNFKSVGFRFTPQLSGAINITTDGPTPEGLNIVNQLRSVTGACGDWRSRMAASFEAGKLGDLDRAVVVAKPLEPIATTATPTSPPPMANGATTATATATFAGVFSVECGDRDWYVSFMDHRELLFGTFARLWKDAGGVLVGAVKEAATAKTARVLYSHASVPLSAMVTDVNKFSNNVMARQLLLTFDAVLNDSPARIGRAALAVGEWTKLRGFDVPELVIENGSGLSRKERISAKSLAKFLEYGLTAPYANDFVQSLPVAATDGTLVRRFINSPTQGNAFLKTGTLTGVKALAGYLQVAGNRRYIFVGMINHANADNAVEVLDGAVEWVFANATADAKENAKTNAGSSPRR